MFLINYSLQEFQDRVAELQNKVTELEEEKGNLLLRLVDFDDHQGMMNLFINYQLKLGKQVNQCACV